MPEPEDEMALGANLSDRGVINLEEQEHKQATLSNCNSGVSDLCATLLDSSLRLTEVPPRLPPGRSQVVIGRLTDLEGLARIFHSAVGDLDSGIGASRFGFCITGVMVRAMIARQAGSWAGSGSGRGGGCWVSVGRRARIWRNNTYAGH